MSLLATVVVLCACSSERTALPTDPGQQQATVTSVTVDPPTATLVAGDTVRFSALARDAQGNVVLGRTFTWAISDSAIARVSSSGLVTALTSGSVTVRASVAGIDGSAIVNVNQPGGPPPGPPSTINLFDDYSPTAPHYRHISFLMHGGYITNGKATSTQLSFDVHHLDHFFVGPTVTLKTAEPSVTNIPYVILLTVPIPAYSTYGSTLSVDFNIDMAAWYAAHPQYNIESAFLHNPDGSRKTVKIWYSGPENNRWVFNPGDPGVTAYHIDRLVRFMTRESVAADGIFVDEMGPWSAASNYIGSKEYPASTDADRARADLVSFVRAIRNGLGAGKMLMINTGDYSDDHHVNLIGAAGASHKELYNNPFTNMAQRWVRADLMLASGAVISLPSPYSADEYAARTDFTPGNSNNSLERGRLFELASYYMVVTTPDKLWMIRKDLDWFKAYEANLGQPTGARSILTSGTDAVGQTYQVWQRPFERALVLSRPQIGASQTGQKYDDATAVNVSLPSGSTWHVLNMDGTTSGAITSVRLRQSEAVILIK